MEGHCSTGQSPQWAVVPMEEEEEEEEIGGHRRFKAKCWSRFKGQADQEEGLLTGCQKTSLSNNQQPYQVRYRRCVGQIPRIKKLTSSKKMSPV